MTLRYGVSLMTVNCRIGSLESARANLYHPVGVNCRIGSLEITGLSTHKATFVNCRIGSLEIVTTH